MRQLKSKTQVRKQAAKVAEQVRRKTLRATLTARCQSSETTDHQRANADILIKHGRKLFSDEEIIDIVWGRNKLLRLLPATIWFRPRDVLDQTEALIYLVKIVTGNKCDGSEKVELSDLQMNLVVLAFAEGLRSENITQEKKRSFEECLRYSRQQIKNILKKCPDLNGEKYSPAQLYSRLGQGSKDSVILELSQRLNTENLDSAQRARLESQIETRRQELIHQREFKKKMKRLPKSLYDRFFNADGSWKQRSG